MTCVVRLASLAGALLIAGHASAAEFNLYLSCEGKLSAGQKSKSATLDQYARDYVEETSLCRGCVDITGETAPEEGETCNKCGQRGVDPDDRRAGDHGDCRRQAA